MEWTGGGARRVGRWKAPALDRRRRRGIVDSMTRTVDSLLNHS